MATLNQLLSSSNKKTSSPAPAQAAAPARSNANLSTLLSSSNKVSPKQASTNATNAAVDAAKRKADYLNSPAGLAIETLKGVGGIFGGAAKGVYDVFANPSAQQLQYEKEKQISLPAGTPTLQRVLTFPGRQAARVITRFINPGLQPLGQDLAEIYEVNRKGGFADQVAEGKLPASFLDELAVLHKTAPQIVGDVAQAVLTAYSGGAGANVASKGLVREGAKTGAKLGGLYGGSAALSEGETDPLKIAASVGLGSLGGGLLGGILSGAIPASRAVIDAIRPAKAAYDVVASMEAKGPLAGTRRLNVDHQPSDYSAGGLYEPYIPASRLPEIEFGPKAPSNGLPSIDADTGRMTRGAPARAPREGVAETAPIELGVPRAAPRAKEVKPVGTGETRLSKLASSVDAKAVEEGLTKSLGDLPEYQTMNIEEQAVLASHLIETNPLAAIQVALGERLPPRGLHPEAVFVALENAAIKSGDVNMLRQLASGNLSTQATAMGQRIRLLGERNPESPVTVIRKIEDARRETLETRSGVSYEKAKTAAVSEVKAEIKKAAPTKETWEGFIKSLECGY